jgi:hypothetical protein
MAKLKFLAVGLIAATSLAAPALAAGRHVASRHAMAEAHASAAPAQHFDEGCILAPRVGAFATAPWTNGPPCEPRGAY